MRRGEAYYLKIENWEIESGSYLQISKRAKMQKKIEIWSDFHFPFSFPEKQSYANATGRILWALDVGDW